MIKWATDFDRRKKVDPSLRGLGALNFTLMLVALVGCETTGFYTEGAYSMSKRCAAGIDGSPILAST